MDTAQDVLFGSFPRRVGTPSQHWLFNEAQFDLFVDAVDGHRNAYSTVSQLHVDGTVVTDKALFDFDGNKDAFPEEYDTARLKVQAMREDPDLAEDVLGRVCDEVREFARASEDDGIPILGVFTGFGVHVHHLYQPTEDAQTAMTTCQTKYIEELNLQTPDWKVVGDVQRLCRVPNVERTNYKEKRVGHRTKVLDGEPTGVYQIPLRTPVLRDLTPAELLDRSRSPSQIETPQSFSERPQMPVWEDYRESASPEGDLPQRPVDQRVDDFEPSSAEAIVKDLLQMPCMAERITQPNPEHEVRLNAAVILFNCGLTPAQVAGLYSGLGWVDYDRDVTRQNLQHIYQHGYSDMTCQTLREKRLCVRTESPEDCGCFGWSGGKCEWKQ